GLLAETFAPRRAHIVLRDDFEDLRSQDAWEVRDAGNRQHEDRADEVPCTIPADRAVRADDVHAPDREPPVLHGECQHEDEAEPEFGDRVTDHAEDADPVILDAPAPQGSDDAERDAHADDEDEREERELKTVRNALEDEIEGGPVVVDRVTEVEVRELPEPFRELHGERLVEAERLVELSAVLLRDLGVPVEEATGGVQEGVRSLVVDRLVHLLQRRLARRLAAVRTVAVFEKGLVDGRAAVADVVELTLALLAGVPDRVRVRVGTERPADDEALEVGARVRAVEERVERLEERVDLDADLLVLLLRELKDRLAGVVALVRLDAHLHR